MANSMESNEDYIGKNILVGLTYLDSDGEVKEQVQFHGVIKETMENSLIFIRSDNREEFSIPFDGELDHADTENIYTLRSTGEEVTGIHYIASFTIHSETENDS